MIAYDIDGVLLGDIFPSPNCSLEELLKARVNMAPIFVPDGEYYLITGRPVIDSSGTLQWIKNFFPNMPNKVFHDNLYFSRPVEYKSKVLSEHPEITIFIESDLTQADFLGKKHPEIEVIWFKTLILQSLRNLKGEV